MVLLSTAILFLIYQNPEESPKTAAFEKHSKELVSLNHHAIKYQENDEQEKLNEHLTIMNEKLKEIAYGSLGFNISIYNQTNAFGGENFPFINSESATRKANDYEKYKEEPYTICNIEEKIPNHLKKISETEMFQMFIKKYSQYQIDLDIMDERYANESNVHYGFHATSKDGNESAGIMFHVNSCTDIKPDQEYNLSCGVKDSGYFIWVHNRDEVIKIIERKGFCLDDLDPWRQSIYDYGKIIENKNNQLYKKLDTDDNGWIDDPESFVAVQNELDGLRLLQNIVNSIVDGRNDEQATQELIQKYNDEFGNFPEDLLELIQRGWTSS